MLTWRGSGLRAAPPLAFGPLSGLHAGRTDGYLAAVSISLPDHGSMHRRPFRMIPRVVAAAAGCAAPGAGRTDVVLVRLR
jgi:hypothetical protein